MQWQSVDGKISTEFSIPLGISFIEFIYKTTQNFRVQRIEKDKTNNTNVFKLITILKDE
jgi:hypothetical protein